jgi:hypothetical protein
MLNHRGPGRRQARHRLEIGVGGAEQRVARMGGMP